MMVYIHPLKFVSGIYLSSLSNAFNDVSCNKSFASSRSVVSYKRNGVIRPVLLLIFSEAYTFHIRCFLNCEYSLLNFDDASLRDFFKYGRGKTDGI